jgi:thiosulfate reductase cytochrome b subunit
VADSVWGASLAAAARAVSSAPRHAALVRVTHWITVACFFALVLTGVQILISHPRFYWGEDGNVNTPALFQLPIPASRGAVQTGYGFVLPDQNGWSRALHFQAAWAVVLTGLLYVGWGLWSGHFRKTLMPSPGSLSWPVLRSVIGKHLRLERPPASEAWSYNVLQRLAYLAVVFILFPLIVWTGLAMSPGITSPFPFVVTVFGGHQSARTLHFFLFVLLVLFALVHVGMIVLAGFRGRMRAMMTGRVPQERI